MPEISLPPGRRARKRSSYDVFISYRRSGGDKVARLFLEVLRERGFSCYLDLANYETGPFDEALLTTIERTRNFLVILSPHAFDHGAGSGIWFEHEIAHALKTRRNIIPIMVDGFEFGHGELAEPIRALEKQNAVEYSHNFFDATVDRIVGQLQLSFAKQLTHALRSFYVVTAASLLVLVVGVATTYRVWTELQTTSATIVAAPSVTPTASTPSPTHIEQAAVTDDGLATEPKGAQRGTATAAAPTPPLRLPELGSRPPRADEAREAVTAVINQYVAAYERRDAAALREIWPSMPESLAHELRTAQSYQLQVTDRLIDIQGDNATVQCVRRINVRAEAGGRLSRNPSTTITLARRGANWIIVTVQ